jgi:collagenase-like PrtC family protease
MWRALGARRITLSLMVNRDFAQLQALARHGGCELEVLANEFCLYRCAYRAYHYGLMSQASRPGAAGSDIDYCHLRCTADRLREPAELVKARFIRPEDVARYEVLGIDLVKLAGRGAPADALLTRARAYLARRWDGNLLDISDLGVYRPDGTPEASLRLDNRALDGLLDQMAAIDCERQCGAGCTLCERFAEKAVRIGGREPFLRGLERDQSALLVGLGRGGAK